MRVTRQIWLQLAVSIVIAVVAFTVMALGYLRLPDLLFGIGHYRVTAQLPNAAGLYERANVTYLGTEVGKVQSVGLTPNGGVEARLSLRSDVKIPGDLDVEVHSTSAVGEQYVALRPRNDTSAPLKDGAIIARSRASVPPDINALLDATNRGLEAIPGDNLKTTLDESYTALAGLGPDLSRLVRGSTTLAIDARRHLDELTNVVDHTAPVLDTQTATASSLQAWASHLADLTRQLQRNDTALRNVVQQGPEAAQQVRQLFDRLQPTLPILMANLAAVAPVLVTYRADLEQILVLLPPGTENMQATTIANRNTRQAYKGGFLSFNLNLNIPPPCVTGFLPAQQRRDPTLVDSPDRAQGDIYCRIPQDAMFNTRGARNTPCETRPGKRAPTVKMCESDENYIPLNNGFNWKGDPNATWTGQSVPQLRPGATPSGPSPGAAAPPAPPPEPLAAAQYDPATGTYVGPDGHVYTRSDLAGTTPKGHTWQQMLTPPSS